MSTKDKKAAFMKRLYENLSKYSQVVIVNVLNVGSAQVHDIRRSLRGKKSDLLIGKNTMIRKVIKWRAEGYPEEHPFADFFKNFGAPKPELWKLSELCVGKIGLIFSDTPVYELKPIIESNKVQTAAKVGVVAPCDVEVAPGPTGMDPSQISFFHALNISTKIVKGQIEITKEIKVTEKGKVVTNSQAALLRKLNIQPFEYGMSVTGVFQDGAILSLAAVSLTPADILTQFQKGASNIVGLSLELGFVNAASAPHLVINAFKNILAISLESGYKIKELDNLTAAAPAQSSGGAAPVKKEAAPVEAEPEDEEDFDGFGGLF